MAADTLFEAEVSDSRTAASESRYLAATGVAVFPGSPGECQLRRSKWGAELRIYFKSVAVASRALALGMHVEGPRPYRDHYTYRINSQELWWELVEIYGFQLGLN